MHIICSHPKYHVQDLAFKALSIFYSLYFYMKYLSPMPFVYRLVLPVRLLKLLVLCQYNGFFLMRPNYSLMLLSQYPSVQVSVSSSQDALGPLRGQRSKFSYPNPPNFRYAPLRLFSTNLLHWSGLNGCMQKCCCFRCHIEKTF